VSDGDKIKVGLTTFTLEVTWQSQNIGNLENYVKSKYSDKLTLDVFNANSKVADQVTHIENMINDEYDVILIDATNPTGLNATLKKARAAGIVVVNYNSEVADPDAYDIKFYADNVEWGSVLAKELCRVLNGKGKIVCMNGFSGVKLSSDRWDGAQAVFKDYLGIEVLAVDNAEWAQAPAEALMTSWITAFPKIDGVWSQGGASTLGAMNVLLNNDMPLIPMTGEDFNGFLKVWNDHINDSGFSTFATGVDTRLGCLALEAAFRIHEGMTLDKEYKLDLPVINNDNLKDFVQPNKPDDYWTMNILKVKDIDKIWPDMN
jgi:ribose transport system substrate-binding protein